MVLSLTTTFGIDTDQQSVIDEAYERIGRQASDLSANDIQSATRSLSMLFSEWANLGVNLWKVELQSQALTQGLPNFALTSDVVEIFNCFQRQTFGGVNTDTQMTGISRADYMAIPNKQQQGTPTQFWFERIITPKIWLWQTPQDASFTMYWNAMLMQDDPGNPTNTLDAPQRFFDAMASGLAARLALKWAPERYTVLAAIAETAFYKAAAEDTENVNMRIVPDLMGRRF